MKNYTISEYGCIGLKDSYNKPKNFVSAIISRSEFNELKQYYNTNKEEVQSIFDFNNGDDFFKAKSYVGVIQTANVSLEILPKIYENENSDKNNIRNIFIEMLKPVIDINDIQVKEADLSFTSNNNILEIFIELFVKSVNNLIKKGLKSEYVSKEDNQYFLKGKLKFNEHIKRNYIHKERFFVEYDEYIQNRAENRLIKSAIKLLLKRTSTVENKKSLRQQQFIFDAVDTSYDIEKDIKKINLHRGMKHYAVPLRFCEVFLKHKSFTSMRGKDNVFALLFPMQTVFEKYMELVLENSKEELGIKQVFVNGYSDDFLLTSNIESDFSKSMAIINQEPDYLLEMQDDKKIITDAKWKILDVKEVDDEEKISIASNDAYQIFSYLNYYTNVLSTAYIFAPSSLKFAKKQEMHYVNQEKKAMSQSIVVIPINLQEVTKTHKLKENIFTQT